MDLGDCLATQARADEAVARGAARSTSLRGWTRRAAGRRSPRSGIPSRSTGVVAYRASACWSSESDTRLSERIAFVTDSALPPALDSHTLLVAAVIVHDQTADQVLLLQRAPNAKFAPQHWDLPVGKADKGEVVTATAARELKEETGPSTPRWPGIRSTRCRWSSCRRHGRRW